MILKLNLWVRTNLPPITLAGVVVHTGCVQSGERRYNPNAHIALPTPQVFTTNAPDADKAARSFLQAWQQEDYDAMYAMLAPQSQANITKEAFVQRYRETANEAASE